MVASPKEQAGCDAAFFGTCTCSASFCGMASRNATSSLERFPQAKQKMMRRRRSALERIFDSRHQLGIAQVLRAIDVVEEVIEPRPQQSRKAVGELPRSEERRV